MFISARTNPGWLMNACCADVSRAVVLRVGRSLGPSRMLRAANGSEIEASIDNEVPETLGLPHISHNWKREELARVELELIERENRRLLGALRLAKDKGGSVDSHPKPDSFHHKSLNEGKRKEEMRLINDSNKKMLTRIVERLKKGTLSEQIAEPKSMQYALLRRNVKPLDAPRPATSVPKPRKAAPTALAPVLSKSMKETSERKPSAASSPHLSSLDRARAAALEELRAGREREASSNLVASLIRGDGLRRPRTMQSTSPTRERVAPPAVPEEKSPAKKEAVPPEVKVEEEGEGKDGKKTRKKKKSAKKAKKIDWETHPFAQPKEALMCLDGGMYSQTNRPITAAHETTVRSVERSRPKTTSDGEELSAFKPASRKRVVGKAKQQYLPLLEGVEKSFTCGPATYNLEFDSATESLYAVGNCVNNTLGGVSLPISCSIPLSTLHQAVSPLTLSLRCWEILVRSDVVAEGACWLPHVSGVTINTPSGGSVLLTTMAAAELFGDHIADLAAPGSQDRWLVFEPPAHPLRSQQSLRLSSDYLMLSCAILPCSDVSAWLPNTLDAVSVDPTQSLAVLVGNVFRSRDSASGTVLLGPATLAALPSVVSGLGLGPLYPPLSADSIQRVSTAMFGLRDTPLALFALCKPCLQQKPGDALDIRLVVGEGAPVPHTPALE